MSKFKKHKKIYYVPGIISLIVIPLILWHYGTQYIQENDYRVLGFNMPPKDYMEEEEFAEVFADMKYDDVKVPSNFSYETELKYLNLVKDLQEKNIDKTAIRFQLTEDNTYGDIVNLLNIMEKAEQPRYGWKLEENTFEVIHIKQHNEDVMMCGTFFLHHDLESVIKSDLNVKEFIQKIPKYFYPILIGYLILMICAIFRPRIFIPL
ncbi:hypothetical protein [Moheibacter sediminis]|uniref:Uncharacterized protein n=1 Tax=Moheibacter sediminis TaxID=1434700 RepID=A0A1W2BT53_9FLAO|nr:hypothetical protein [Moheibacter sediminis]SMC76069.1 hypothetical protein SAMN06296427_107109 [Moheibacter sediminis]